jgi:hypothetical protein
LGQLGALDSAALAISELDWLIRRTFPALVSSRSHPLPKRHGTFLHDGAEGRRSGSDSATRDDHPLDGQAVARRRISFDSMFGCGGRRRAWISSSSQMPRDEQKPPKRVKK